MKGIRGKKSDNIDAKNIATQIMIGSGCKVVEPARRLKRTRLKILVPQEHADQTTEQDYQRFGPGLEL